MSAIMRDALTAWHTDDHGATWERSVITGARVEESLGSEAGQVGPTPRPTVRAWLRGGCGLVAGDYVARGERQGDAPPADASRVEAVERWDLRGSAHHWEVTAR